ASSSTRDSPGLRACTSRSSRHSSVVSNVPRPFTSMLPPSRTTSRPPHCAGNSRSLRRRATRSGTWSSFFQSGYLAQALKRNRMIATSAGGRARRTNIGPESLADPRVGVDPPVAQERPAAAHLLDTGEIHLSDEDRFAIARRLRHHDAERVGEERRTPELDAVRAITGALRRALVPDAVHCGDEETVRDRVRTLDRAPGVELLGAVLLPLARVPADRRGIEKDV